MKILHVLEAMGGGTRRHVLDLLPALAARGIDCTLAVSPNRNWPGTQTFADDINALRSRGVRVEIVPMPRSLGSGAALLRLVALQKREHFDLVHAHSSVAGALARIGRLATRVPVVYTPHCIAFDTGLPARQRRVARLLEQLLAPLTTHYIAVSHHEQRAIRSRGLSSPNRVTTIHNGLDLSELDGLPPRARAEFGLGDEDFVIGCFGRLTRQKNQTALLRALPAILKAVPHAKLFLVGGGEDEASLKKVAVETGIFAHTAWAGEQTEARNLYALCDAIAQPSLWEGCPYSVLEAMAARRVVVARRVGGVGEILDENFGVSYGQGQKAALADAICSIAHDMGRKKYIEEAARQRIEQSYTLEQMAQSTLDIYRRCLR